MSLIDGIKSLFGEGKIRVEGETDRGRKFVCKVPYVGDPTTLDEKELFARIRKQVLVETGQIVKADSLRIIGMTHE